MRWTVLARIINRRLVRRPASGYRSRIAPTSRCLQFYIPIIFRSLNEEEAALALKRGSSTDSERHRVLPAGVRLCRGPSILPTAATRTTTWRLFAAEAPFESAALHSGNAAQLPTSLSSRRTVLLFPARRLASDRITKPAADSRTRYSSSRPAGCLLS